MNTNNEKLFIALIVLLAALYYLPGVFSPRDFWVEDEARYAEILREMVHDGKWLVPHLNGTFYSDKPPLYYWLCGSLAFITGITPWSCMLITWISALGSLFAVYFFGRLLYTSRAAFYGTLSLMSTLLFLGCAQIVRMDMLLACFILWAVTFFYTGHLRKNPRYYFLFYLFTGLAVLSKGPFGFTFAFFPPFLFLLIIKDFKGLGRFVFHWGFLLLGAIVGGWLITAWLSGYGDYIHDIFFRQIAGRVVKSFSHREPFYYYLVILPFSLLPWFPFMIRSTIDGFRRHRQSTLFLSVFFLAGFITLSVISSKLVVYLVPLLAAWTLPFGASVERFLHHEKPGAVSSALEETAALVFSVGIFIALPFVEHRFPLTHPLALWPFAFVFAPLLAAGTVFILLRKRRLLIVLLFISMWIFSCLCFQHVVPEMNAVYSGRGIGGEIRALTEEGKEGATYDVRRGILNFYAGRNIRSIPRTDLKSYFLKENRFLVMKKKHFIQFQNDLGVHARIGTIYEIANELYGIVQTGENP